MTLLCSASSTLGRLQALASLFPARLETTGLPSTTPSRQTNHGRNVTWTPQHAFSPGTDIEELARVMRWAFSQTPAALPIKAGGSRHAWSPAAATDGVYIQPERMRFIEPAGAPGMFRVGAGTRLRELNRALWDAGYAFPVFGGFDGQTLGGALPTGTHGSVLAQGPLAESFVRSIDLVTANGRIVRIEPKNGITDRGVFRREHPGWELVQDDTTFHAALINLGTFGVVHSYVVAPVERFYMREQRTLSTGRSAQAILRNGGIYGITENDRAVSRPTFPGHPAKAYHLELLWNVYSDALVVTSRQPIAREHNAELDKTAANYPNPSRSLWQTLTVPSKYTRPRWALSLFDQLHGLVGLYTGIANAIAPRSSANTLVDGLLRMMPDNDGFVGRSYSVFNIGDGVNALPSESATLSVPLAGDAYLEAMEIIRRVAADFSAAHQGYQTGPISLRFVKGSQALLADPVDVCKLEIIFSGNGPSAIANARALVTAYDNALRERFGDDIGFHFGQLVPDSRKGPLDGPRAAAFDAVRKRFDPHGRMLNAWERELFTR